MAFETDESVLFREVSLIQGVLIERFHCIHISREPPIFSVCEHACMESIVGGGTLSIRACSHTENMAGLRDYNYTYVLSGVIIIIPIYYYIKKEKSKKEKNTLNLDNDM